MPQTPQLSGSLVVSTQARPPPLEGHIAGSLGGHVQTPLSHIIPDAMPVHIVPSAIFMFVQLPDGHTAT
jgi:hypothetical protein